MWMNLMSDTVPHTRRMFLSEVGQNVHFYRTVNQAIAQSIVDTPESCIAIDANGTLQP